MWQLHKNALDRAALQSLELTQTAHGHGKRGSLLSILDRTQTAMGGRLLRDWIERPLSDAGEIEARLDAVECFTKRLFEANALREALERVNVETLTPIEAMNVLYQLKQML